MGVRLRSWDQTAKWGMAHEKFSSSEESTHEQIQGENHNYCFLSTAVALCTKNLYLQDRQLITPSTKMSWNDFENWSSESEGTLLHTIGCCNTITLQLTLRFKIENFWRRKSFPYIRILPTDQFYLREISTSSLSWNRSWRIIISGRWKIYKKL